MWVVQRSFKFILDDLETASYLILMSFEGLILEFKFENE